MEGYVNIPASRLNPALQSVADDCQEKVSLWCSVHRNRHHSFKPLQRTTCTFINGFGERGFQEWVDELERRGGWGYLSL